MMLAIARRDCTAILRRLLEQVRPTGIKATPVELILMIKLVF